MTLPFGIDISKHQGVNDYAKMRANTAFVFVKATESWGYTDPKFYANWQGLVGHNRGAYCYVWLSDDPLRQANHLCDIVTQAGVDWKYDRLVLDLEKSGHGLSKAEVSRRVLVMMERIKEVTGRYPILYSRKYWVQDNMLLTDPRLINADWWLAYYRTALPYPLFTPEMSSPPLMPVGVNKWLFHQTCEKGKGREVGVGSYYVDQNRFNGTQAELLAYFGHTEDEPEPEPSDEVLFRAKVTATLGLRVRAGAGLSYPISATSMTYGTVVDVYEIRDGWYRHDKGGWSDGQWLQRIDDTPTPPVIVNEPYYGALYWQRDPRWKDVKLGTSGTIGAYGCAMCAETNALNQLGINTNPMINNTWRTNNGGYKNGNLINWEKVSEQHPEIVWEGRTYNPTDSQMLAKIASGSVLVILVDHNESTAVLDEHWVNSVYRGDNQLWVFDPWDGQLVRLRDRYKKAILQFTEYRRAK